MAAGDDYPLQRDRSEVQRNLGYYIHPTVQATLPVISRVADIGTGSGAYLLGLAKQVSPSTQLDGFDISRDQFPSSSPENVRFHTQDAKIPVPVTFHGQYDFIHLRCLTLALDKDDWYTVMLNICQMLKPGGAIQWEEPDAMGVKVYRGPSASQPTAMTSLSNLFLTMLKNRSEHGYHELPSVMEQAGLRNIVRDVVSSDLHAETREVFTRMSVAGQLNIARRAVELGRDVGWTMEDVHAKEREIEEEVKAGCYIRYDLSVTVGFLVLSRES